MFHLVHLEQTFGSLALNGPILLLLQMVSVAFCNVWVTTWKTDGCVVILTQLSTLGAGQVISMGQVFPETVRTISVVSLSAPLSLISAPYHGGVSGSQSCFLADLHGLPAHLFSMDEDIWNREVAPWAICFAYFSHGTAEGEVQSAFFFFFFLFFLPRSLLTVGPGCIWL